MSAVTGFFEEFRQELHSAYSQRCKDMKNAANAVADNIKALTAEQDQLLESYHSANSQIIRQKTEISIERLQKQIDDAEAGKLKKRVSRSDLRDFMLYAKYLLEHPQKVLVDNAFPYEQKAFFSLVFDGLPSWHEIKIGTPIISPIFTVSERFKSSKPGLVRLDEFDWNQIEDIIIEWNAVFEQNIRIKKLAQQNDKHIRSENEDKSKDI